MKSIILSNGICIPIIGYGTWQTPDGETAINSVKKAIDVGYTHIDTAACYKNEKSIGEAIKEFDRKKLFITSKVWNTERGYDKTIAAFKKTLSDLNTDYLDLYLIHWPASSHQFDNWIDINNETWRALEDLYMEGKIRSIGVSNFLPHHLEQLLTSCRIRPMVNQIEIHPGFLQKECCEYCIKNEIAIEAWSPLGTGVVLQNEEMVEIAKKYHKSVAQICIRWVLDKNIIPLVKSVHEQRMKDNLDVWDFELSPEDTKKIDNMSFGGGQCLNPDEVDF